MVVLTLYRVSLSLTLITLVTNLILGPAMRRITTNWLRCGRGRVRQEESHIMFETAG
jgi:hypothetical protein